MPATHPIARRSRLLAFALDAAGLLLAFGVALVLAMAWLLLRTGAGRFDAGDGDSVVAASMLGAAPAAWVAWLASSVQAAARTPGQRRAGLAVERLDGAPATAPYVRLALHPLALPAWLWLALVALVGGLPWLPGAALVVAALLAAAGVGSFVLLLVRPTAPALHDHLARTRLVARP